MIIAITKEQAQRGREFYDRWLGRALYTGTIDDAWRRHVESGFTEAYATKDLPAPEVKWYSSPLKGLTAAVFAITSEQRTVTDKLVEEDLAQTMRFLSQNIDLKVHQVLQRELCDKIGRATASIDPAILTELSIRASVVGDKRPKTGAILSKLVDRTCAGALDAHRLAIVDYADQVLGLATGMRGIVRASTAGMFWPMERLVIATESPIAIRRDDDGKVHAADGPAVEYADGFTVYCRHGVRVPREAIEGGVDWKLIEVTADARVKDALADDKAEKWAKQKKETSAVEAVASVLAAPDKPVETETEAERVAAALAIKRLGGFGALKDLVEGEQ